MTDPSDSPEHHAAVEFQSLTMAAGAIEMRSRTPEGLDTLIEHIGDVSNVALAMRIIFNRLKDHADKSKQRAA